MPMHVIIDGNNLLHAMHAHAPIPTVGRETMVKVIERWARRGHDDVTLIFDGPVPPEGLARQMTSSRITVRFSAPQSADDLIVAQIARAEAPTRLRVVTSDTAIRREARYRRCRHTDSASFVAELFAPREGDSRHTCGTGPAQDKPGLPSSKQTDEWLAEFGYQPDDGEEPFDGHDAMTR